MPPPLDSGRARYIEAHVIPVRTPALNAPRWAQRSSRRRRVPRLVARRRPHRGRGTMAGRSPRRTSAGPFWPAASLASAPARGTAFASTTAGLPRPVLPQPAGGSHGQSEVVDPAAYHWATGTGGAHRAAASCIYEMHVGALHAGGDVRWRCVPSSMRSRRSASMRSS